MRHTIAILVGLAGILAAALFMAAYIWWQLSSVTISMHGKAALALGVVGTFGLGVGLMRLTYWSHSKGYDEQAQRHDPNDPKIK
ncbi:MAG: hypothetical protein AAFY56_11480 [Pseudomonadota bacterium]